MCAPQGLSIPPPWDAAPQVPCTGLGHASDTQILPPEPSTTPKKEKDTDGEKEKKEKGLDFPSCPNEGAKHPKSSAEKHREKHKERWGLLPAVGGHQPHGQGIGGANTRTPSCSFLMSCLVYPYLRVLTAQLENQRVVACSHGSTRAAFSERREKRHFF